ncbi:MAG TPA: glutathione S-transferase family protein [Burkholderiales bacterium]|nr:glutathione S-transferase family protein [Burkholderiales bacterium]
MAIELHSWPRSSGTRISWALEELGVPYTYVEVDAKKKENLAPGHLALNPHGKVPALVDGEQHFFESLAILIHLAHKYGIEKKLWPSAGGQDRADALCWTVWSMTELGPYMMQYLYHGMDTPVSYKPEDRSKATAAYNKAQLERILDALEARLAKRDYIVGIFTLADLAAASWLMLGTMFGLPLDRWPRAAAWLKRCSDRPALKKAR